MMPAGLLMTVPLPVPWRETETVKSSVLSNCAVTLALLVPAGIVQLLLVPLQAPLQPVNTLPLVALAVRVTALVLANLAEAKVHSSSAQSKPLGLLLTLPIPVPLLLKVTMRVIAVTLKVAVTLEATYTKTSQLLLVPVQ